MCVCVEGSSEIKPGADEPQVVQLGASLSPEPQSDRDRPASGPGGNRSPQTNEV